jgi:fatty acid desaturase
MATTTRKQWHRSLPGDLREAIRELHTLDRWYNWISVYFLLNWAAAAWVVLSIDHAAVRIVGTIWIGIVIHGLANLMHDACHGNLFRNPRLDRFVGFLCGAPALFSVTAYRVTHALHHRHNRTMLDPDEFMNITNRKGLLSVLFYLWLFVGMFLYLIHVPVTALLRGTPRERRRIATEYAVLGMLYAAVIGVSIHFGFFDNVVAVWLLPLLVAAFFGNVRGWAEHMLTKKGHPLTESRTVLSSRLFSLHNVNLNYHTEHHLYPGIPWYNLPELHRLLLPEYRRAGTSIYRSYLRFLIDAVRIGVHGLAPEEPVTAGLSGFGAEESV